MTNEWYEKIVALKRKHNLGFLQNPGGGEFTGKILENSNFRSTIQIGHNGDYEEDYKRLYNSLVERGIEDATI